MIVLLVLRKTKKKLFEMIEFNTNIPANNIDYHRSSEISRDRFEIREVSVYKDFHGIDRKKWKGLKEIIKVDREFHKKNKITKETSYYISTFKTSAVSYSKLIRDHWAIENSLHYVKDVTFNEDASKVRTKNAPINFSVMRNIAINSFRKNGYSNMAQAKRLVCNNISKIKKLLLA